MRKICLIYTGGTIGMRQNVNGKLAPVDFEELRKNIPALRLLPIELEVKTMDRPLDSSEMHPSVWVDLATEIYELPDLYDGFVVLHGTDTMDFTARALSFMLRGLKKPALITGSQLPVGVLRTASVDNLLSALAFAAMEESGAAFRVDVCT